MKFLNFIYFLQIANVDWKSFAWAIAVFSGFGVKIAYEVSERIRTKQAITKLFWIGNLCSLFITFVVGYYSRPMIVHFTSNAEAQAGLYAVVGAVGFELFKIFYRIATNRKLWEQFVGVLMNRVANGQINSGNQTPTDNEPATNA